MPQDVFKSFKSLYDTVMKDDELLNFGDKLVGQVTSEPFVKSEKLDTEVTFRDFCIDAVRNFVLVQKRQNYGHDPRKLAEIESDKLILISSPSTSLQISMIYLELNPISTLSPI